MERVIVWGLIGALLVTVGIEARAQQGYANSLDAVQAAFADTEEVQIDLADARKLMTLSPVEVKDADASGLMDYYQFSWFSLFKSGGVRDHIEGVERQFRGDQLRDVSGSRVWFGSDQVCPIRG